MSNVMRICPHCGEANLLDSRFCAHCGADTQANLAASGQNNLPAVIGRAALPVLVGAASLALSAGWKLLQGALARQAAQPPAAVKTNPVIPVARRPRVTVTIRTAWTVGDSSGKWQKGQSEQTIEFGE